MQVSRYLPTASLPLSWLGDVGADLSAQVQIRLRSMLFGSISPIVYGSLISIAVVMVAYFRSGNPAFLFIAGLDIFLLPVRTISWRQPARLSGLAFLTGIVWAGLIAATVFLTIPSQDMPMALLATAWAFASVSAILARNFLAPRYALTQASLISLSIGYSIAVLEPKFLVFNLILGISFVVISARLVQSQRRMTIQIITAEIKSHARSLCDPLTGLCNRRGLEAAFETITVERGRSTGLIYLDLDGFKKINDRLGHGTGDSLLVEVARRLTGAIPLNATACRLGGDEFLVLVCGIEAEELRALGGQIIQTIAAPYYLEGTIPARIGASVGAVTERSETANLSHMMVLADQALYSAKTTGKGRCVLHVLGAVEDSCHDLKEMGRRTIPSMQNGAAS